MTIPSLKHPKRVEFACAAQSNDQQQAADQTSNDSGSDDSRGHDHRAALLVASITTIILGIAHPALKHAAVVLAVKVSRLAEKAVLLV